MQFISSKERFYSIIMSSVKMELGLTQQIESRVYAFVTDDDGDSHVCMKELPETDFDGDVFTNIAETTATIHQFRQAMKGDGLAEKAIMHLQVFKNTGEEKKTMVVFVSIAVNPSGKADMLEKKIYELVGGEMIINDDGEMVEAKKKLVASNLDI